MYKLGYYFHLPGTNAFFKHKLVMIMINGVSEFNNL